MDARTRLAFFILKTHAGWLVRVDGFVYPPCTTQADAFAKAIREAKAAERLGFASVVLAQSAAGETLFCPLVLCRRRRSSKGSHRNAAFGNSAHGGHPAIRTPIGGTPMTTLFHSIDGRYPHGADVLREQLRWGDAERRWHPAPHNSLPDQLPPAYPPPGHASLLRGALLTRLTTACAAVGTTAMKKG